MSPKHLNNGTYTPSESYGATHSLQRSLRYSVYEEIILNAVLDERSKFNEDLQVSEMTISESVTVANNFIQSIM